jgi:hypothetical protein
MTYLEKLAILEGGKIPESLPIYQKVARKKTLESAAKSMFTLLTTDKKDRTRAKKLGLVK